MPREVRMLTLIGHEGMHFELLIGYAPIMGPGLSGPKLLTKSPASWTRARTRARARACARVHAHARAPNMMETVKNLRVGPSSENWPGVCRESFFD